MGLSDADGKPIGAMYWYSDRIPGDELVWNRVEMSVEGLSLEDPVLVDAVTGRVYDLPLPHGSRDGGRMKLTGCPVWDAPMLLIEPQRRAVPRRSRRTQGRRNPSGYALLTQLFR